VKVKDYKDLKVWQKGIEIVDKIYAATSRFPKDEVYGLITQMRKAAVSVPTNIAEGFVRHHTKEYKQFLHISLGSCAELDTQLIIADRRKYLKKNDLEELTEDINHETRMLVNLINKL
jgi:four helix bundle protein